MNETISYSEVNMGDKVTILTSLYRRPKQTGTVYHIATAPGYEGIGVKTTYGELFLPKRGITKIIRHV